MNQRNRGDQQLCRLPEIHFKVMGIPPHGQHRADQAAVKHKAIGEQQIDRLQAGKNLLEMLDQIRQNGNKI